MSSHDLMLNIQEVNELLSAFRRGEWTNQEVKQLTEGDALTTFKHVLLGKSKVVPADGNAGSVSLEVFLLEVNYGRTLEEMSRGHQLGNYVSNEVISSEEFSVIGEGVVEVEAKIFHFNRKITSDEAKILIEQAGWEVARIEHLLAFGAKYPGEQLKSPIIELGSVAQDRHGKRNVVQLDRSGLRGVVYYHRWNGSWVPRFRFLAIRKKSLS